MADSGTGKLPKQNKAITLKMGGSLKYSLPFCNFYVYFSGQLT
jgi:hypothetical protein